MKGGNLSGIYDIESNIFDRKWHNELKQSIDELRVILKQVTSPQSFTIQGTIFLCVPDRKSKKGNISPLTAARILKNLNALINLCSQNNNVKLYLSSYNSHNSIFTFEFEQSNTNFPFNKSNIENALFNLKTMIETAEYLRINIQRMDLRKMVNIISQNLDDSTAKAKQFIKAFLNICPLQSEIFENEYFILGLTDYEFGIKLFIEHRLFFQKLYAYLNKNNSNNEISEITATIKGIETELTNNLNAFTLNIQEKGINKELKVYYKNDKNRDKMIKNLTGQEVNIIIQKTKKGYIIKNWGNLERKYNTLLEKRYNYSSLDAPAPEEINNPDNDNPSMPGQKHIIKKSNGKKLNQKAEESYKKGFLALENNDTVKAIHYFKKAIDYQGENAFLYACIGYSYMIGRDYTMSIRYYERALEFMPDYTVVYLDMGLAYNELGEYEKAIKSFLKAIELHPGYFRSYLGLGISYFKKNDFNKAISYFSKAVEINPSNYDAYNNLGVANGACENHDKAIQCFNKCLEIKPEYPRAYYNLGIANLKKENIKQAKEYAQKALEIDKSYSPAKTLLNEIAFSKAAR